MGRIYKTLKFWTKIKIIGSKLIDLKTLELKLLIAFNTSSPLLLPPSSSSPSSYCHPPSPHPTPPPACNYHHLLILLPQPDPSHHIICFFPVFSSLKFTETELVGGTTIPTQDLNHLSLQGAEGDTNLRYEVDTSSSTSRNVSNQLHHFMNFVHDEMKKPMTQSTVVGSSCPTTTLINSSSAPMLSSTTFSDANRGRVGEQEDDVVGGVGLGKKNKKVVVVTSRGWRRVG